MCYLIDIPIEGEFFVVYLSWKKILPNCIPCSEVEQQLNCLLDMMREVQVIKRFSFPIAHTVLGAAASQREYNLNPLNQTNITYNLSAVKRLFRTKILGMSYVLRMCFSKMVPSRYLRPVHTII